MGHRVPALPMDTDRMGHSPGKPASHSKRRCEGAAQGAELPFHSVPGAEPRGLQFSEEEPLMGACVGACRPLMPTSPLALLFLRLLVQPRRAACALSVQTPLMTGSSAFCAPVPWASRAALFGPLCPLCEVGPGFCSSRPGAVLVAWGRGAAGTVLAARGWGLEDAVGGGERWWPRGALAARRVGGSPGGPGSAARALLP